MLKWVYSYSVTVISRTNSQHYRTSLKTGFCKRVGKCMELLGVEAVDTRYKLGRERFIPYNLNYYLFPSTNESENWFSKISYYPQKSVSTAC